MLETLARLGYASKAVIYTIVGSLAIAVATGRGGRVTDTSGALRVMLARPAGRIVLLILAVGLFGYALWRALNAIRDPENHGAGAKGIAIRLGNAGRALIYGGIGMEAFRLFNGMGSSRKGEPTQMWTARIMHFPLGVWIVGIAGLIVAVYGLWEIIVSIRGHRNKSLDLSAMRAEFRKGAEAVSRFGVAARGLIIMVLGVFLVRAALQRDPSEARGTRDSILEIVDLADGVWILGFIGAGLLAYAFNQALHARYRRIAPVV